MPLETARRAVDMVLDSGAPLNQVGYFGGEPLVRFDLMKEITRYVRERTSDSDKPVTMVCTTNGTLLDGERLDWLVQNDFHLGVSLDGVPGAHDACRVKPDGSGSSSEVEAGLRRALDKGLPVKTISVVDPASVDLMPDSLAYLLGLGVRSMSFNLNYEADWDDAARDRFTVAINRFADAYADAWRQGFAFKANILDAKIISHLKMGFACSDRCDFGCNEVAVSPSGKLYPCDRLIGEDTRDDVIIGTVESGVDIAARDRLIEAKNAVLEGCKECELLPRCMHWCGCVNHAMTGKVGEVSGLLCWFEQEIIAAADRVAEQLFAEQSPAFLRRFYTPMLK